MVLKLSNDFFRGVPFFSLEDDAMECLLKGITTLSPKVGDLEAGEKTGHIDRRGHGPRRSADVMEMRKADIQLGGDGNQVRVAAHSQ